MLAKVRLRRIPLRSDSDELCPRRTHYTGAAGTRKPTATSRASTGIPSLCRRRVNPIAGFELRILDSCPKGTQKFACEGIRIGPCEATNPSDFSNPNSGKPRSCWRLNFRLLTHNTWECLALACKERRFCSTPDRASSVGTQATGRVTRPWEGQWWG